MLFLLKYILIFYTKMCKICIKLKHFALVYVTRSDFPNIKKTQSTSFPFILNWFQAFFDSD